jgi:hypothetical protein
MCDQLKRNHLMVEAIRMNGVVKIPQKLSTLTRDKMNSCDFALLKCLRRIESVAEQLSVPS